MQASFLSPLAPAQSKRTKKVGIVGKYGTRYGASLRKVIKKMEVSQHSKYFCNFCGKVRCGGVSVVRSPADGGLRGQVAHTQPRGAGELGPSAAQTGTQQRREARSRSRRGSLDAAGDGRCSRAGPFRRPRRVVYRRACWSSRGPASGVPHMSRRCASSSSCSSSGGGGVLPWRRSTQRLAAAAAATAALARDCLCREQHWYSCPVHRGLANGMSPSYIHSMHECLCVFGSRGAEEGVTTQGARPCVYSGPSTHVRASLA